MPSLPSSDLPTSDRMTRTPTMLTTTPRTRSRPRWAEPRRPDRPAVGDGWTARAAARLVRRRQALAAAVGDGVETLSPPGPRQAAGSSLVVATYNVHKCVGADRRYDPARVAAVIAELGADLVALQEADRRFGRRTGLLDAMALERETGLALVPVSDLPDGHGWHGNALLVRRGAAQITRVRRFDLPGAEPRGAVLTELALPVPGTETAAAGGAPVVRRLRVVAAHFGLLRRCRTRQAAAILETITAGETMPTLLLGDLNEWRPGRRSSLRTLETVFGAAPGLTPPSFPARLPVLSLDRVLGWPHGLVESVEVHDSLLARVASDHLPLRARIDLAAAGAAAVPRSKAPPPLAVAA